MTTQSQLLQDIIDTHQNVTSKAFNPMEQSGITVRKAMPTYCSTSMLASAFAPPKVSLVMTVYNNEATLSEVLESLLAQTFTNWELILWDDGSTDGSVAIAQTYAQQDNRIRFYQGDRLGLGPALIKAHTYTKGEYVGWVNPSKRLEANALKETIPFLDTHLDYGMVHINPIARWMMT